MGGTEKFTIPHRGVPVFCLVFVEEIRTGIFKVRGRIANYITTFGMLFERNVTPYRKKTTCYVVLHRASELDGFFGNWI
jgi:hypothetical protein